jgi:enamine deaminase RidA (YjgF/YER057c/UK114 family)
MNPEVRNVPVSTTDAPAAIGTYSQAVSAGNTIYLSGQIALDPKAMTLVEGGIEAQVRRVFEICARWRARAAVTSTASSSSTSTSPT